jgi:ubiquinone/menaquinone biosynthesis C-methylase UbiE
MYTTVRDPQELKTLYKNSEETVSYWEDKWGSRDYQKMVAHELYNHTFRATIDTFVEQNLISDGQRVLDIGCGWGRIAVGLIKRFPTLKISGIDISEEAISRGPAIIERETGVPDIDFRVANAEQLPFEDGVFDCVVSTRVFQYISDPQKAMQEIVRVLKPNGRVTLSVPNKLNPVRYFSYHTQLLTTKDLSRWMASSNLKDLSTGTMVFCPPTLLRFSENSWWVPVDRMLSNIPGLRRIGGLAWASAQKPG